jgi:hypothetical protein
MLPPLFQTLGWPVKFNDITERLISLRKSCEYALLLIIVLLFIPAMPRSSNPFDKKKNTVAHEDVCAL